MDDDYEEEEDYEGYDDGGLNPKRKIIWEVMQMEEKLFYELSCMMGYDLKRKLQITLSTFIYLFQILMTPLDSSKIKPWFNRFNMFGKYSQYKTIGLIYFSFWDIM